MSDVMPHSAGDGREDIVRVKPLEKSLLSNTLLPACIASIIVAVLFIAITFSLTQQRAEKRALSRLGELIESTGTMASAACFAHDATLAAETAQAFVKNGEVLSIRIYSGNRELAYATHSGVKETETTVHKAAKVLRQAIYSPFSPSEQIGEIVVEPNYIKINQAVSEEVGYAIVMLVILAICIIGVIAFAIMFFVIQPVKSISDKLHTMNATTSEKLSIPPGHAKNELGRLVGDINDLLRRFTDSLRQVHEVNLQRVVGEKLRLAAEVFEHSQEGIMVTDQHNHIVTVNRAFCEITGYSEDEVLGRNPRLLSSGQQSAEFYTRMWSSILKNGHWKGELWNRRKDGEVIPKWFSITTVKNEQGEIISHVAIFSDISERKDAEEKITFLAHHDPLTKLPNRVLLRDRFMQARSSALRDGTGMTLFYLDLDNFKQINDSFGHHVGDLLLIAVVERLGFFMRNTDTICRQGGDEFIIILPGMCDLDVITRLAQSILDAIAKPFDLAGNSIGISASIGISLLPVDGDDFDDLLRNADAAMYDAKSRGKNAYRYFTPEMNTEALDKLQLQSNLRDALKNSEFVLHYQPQVDLTSNSLIGVEALIRWQHPELGLISPIRFIPLAEDCGLIIPIGEWVINEACRQGRIWIDAGYPPLSVAVNISALQFNRGNIFEMVQEALRVSAFPPEYLELELTESVLINDVVKTLETIRSLKNLGIKLSIDDFGTGYSSLSYLKQIRVDKLKIDQSFVRDIGNDPDDLAIVCAIIQLGKTLQLRVIAEGVETDAQLQELIMHGCDEAQGYLFSKAVPPERLAACLQSGRQSADKLHDCQT